MFNRKPSHDSDRLAEAILDGERIEWGHEPASTSHALRGLRVLDGIARAVRESAGGVGPTVGKSQGRHGIPGWTLVLLAFVGLRICVAGWGIHVGAGLGAPVPAWAPAAATAAFGAAAVWLMSGGGGDVRASYLAAFFLLLTDAFAQRFTGWVDGSSAVRSVLARGLCVDAFVPWVLWRFVREFPRIVHLSRTDSLCRRAERFTLAVGLALFAVNLIGAVLNGAGGLTWLRRAPEGAAYWTIIACLAAPALPVACLRARTAPAGERRRVVLFAAALAFGIVPPLLTILLEIVSPPVERVLTRPGMRAAVTPLFYGFVLSVPFTTAYSVLVDRVLDVRIVIGRALQHVFARATVVLFTVLPFTAFLLHAYQRRDASVAALLSERQGRWLAGLTVLGLVAFAARTRILRLVDRWFLHVSADWPTVLPVIAERLRNARTVIDLAEALDTELRRELLLTGAVMFLDRSERHDFSPVNRAVTPLPGDGALATIIRSDAAAIDVRPGPRHALHALLPREDRRWLTEVGATLIVPLVGSRDARLGFVSVGPKRSGLSFTREESSFVAAVVSTVALGVQDRLRTLNEATVGSRPPSDEPAAECEGCGRIVEWTPCPCSCGGRRRAAALPLLLSAKFRVERLLGSGGMGIVYKGRDLTLDRSVALKTLPRVTGDAVLALEREARLMASVVHPNLALIFALESWRSTPILVVELLDGGTLAARITQGPQPVDEVLRLGLLLAPALEQLHLAGVLHRDIKPSNIAFSARQVPKLLDFGLASFVADPCLVSDVGEQSDDVCATRSVSAYGGVIAGTPLYLSPEAAAGAQPSPASDLWSLAMVLYECIAGRHPVRTGSVRDVLHEIGTLDVADLRAYRADCPAPVAAAFGRLLSKKREQRPRTAAELTNILDDLLRRCT